MIDNTPLEDAYAEGSSTPLAKAYTQGVVAFQEGKSLDENPYPESNFRRKYFIDGWVAALFGDSKANGNP